MAENERKPTPTLWMIILALLGLYTLPKASSPGPESGAPEEGAKAASTRLNAPAQKGAPSGGGTGISQLILKHYCVRTAGPEDKAEIGEKIKKADGLASVPDIHQIRCLIATLPDPNHCSSGYLFDEGLTALQRGVESQGYVLDRYSFPWTEKSVTPRPALDLELWFPGALRFRVATDDPPRARNQPGLIVFRSTQERSTQETETESPLLLVFLVLESPISGLDKEALAESLDWAKALDSRNGIDLRLMSSLNDVCGIPTEGKNLIIVAAVNSVLHFRIFDGDGKVVVDTDEKRLTEQARQIEDLRKQLESLWPPHVLTRSDKGRVITAVTSIVGHTRPYYFNLLGPNFSGSQHSLKQALTEWLAQPQQKGDPQRGHHFEVISGSAVAIDKEHLEQEVARTHGRNCLEFHATVHTSKVVWQVIRDYIAPRPTARGRRRRASKVVWQVIRDYIIGSSKDEPIAMLVESNTRFGQMNLPAQAKGESRPPPLRQCEVEDDFCEVEDDFTSDFAYQTYSKLSITS
jgi:hypothetical protein